MYAFQVKKKNKKKIAAWFCRRSRQDGVASTAVCMILQRETRVVWPRTGIEVSAFACRNLLSASLAPVIVLPSTRAGAER